MIAFHARLHLRANVLWAVAEFSVNIVLVYLGYRLLIHHGGLEAVGVWAILYAWASLARLGDAGLGSAALRFIALHDHREQPGRVAALSQTAILANSALFAVLVGSAYLLLRQFTGQLVGVEHAAVAATVLLPLCGSLLALNISGTILGALQGLHLGYQRSIVSMAGTLTQLGLVILLVPSYGLVGFALAQIAQHSVGAVLGWMLIRHALGIPQRLPSRFDPAAFRQMLGFSLRTQAATAINGLFEPLSKIVLSQFTTIETQGLYELAYKAVALARNLVAAALAATLPAFTALGSTQPAALEQLYRRATHLTTAAALMAMAAVTLFSPLLGRLWLGTFSLPLSFFVAVLALGFSFNTLGAPAYNLGFAADRLRGNVVASLAAVSMLAVLGTVAGALFAATGVVCVVGLSLAASGMVVRHLNEKLLAQTLQWAT